jgi:hypothetical protein
MVISSVHAQASLPRESECDHLVGLRVASFPQYGETDRLVRSSEKLEPDDPFNYCPVCGGLFVVPAFTRMKYRD